MYNTSAERAAMDTLQWTRDMNEAKAIAHDVAVAYAQHFRALSEPAPGLCDWLDALQAANVPCALVANLDRCVCWTALRAKMHHSSELGVMQKHFSCTHECAQTT